MRREKATLAQFAAALRQDGAPLLLLTGPAWFQAEAAARLEAAAGAGASVERWREGEFAAGELVEAARARSLFGGARLLIALGLKDRDARALVEQPGADALAADPAPGCRAVLGFAEKRAITAKFFAADGIDRWDFAELYPEKLPAFAGDLARERGFALPAAAARAIVDASGGEPGVIAAEIAKLALLAENGRLDEAAALAVIAAPEAGEYELSGRIEQGDRDGALRTLATELDGGRSLADLVRVAGGGLLTLLVARTAPGPGLAAAIGKPPFIAERIARGAAPLAESRLRAGLRRLARLEWRSRRGGGEEAGAAELAFALRAALTPARR